MRRRWSSAPAIEVPPSVGLGEKGDYPPPLPAELVSVSGSGVPPAPAVDMMYAVLATLPECSCNFNYIFVLYTLW